ncbi:hypothetical protein BDV18DRAFT_70148 [Aspergillus unguis]
MPSLNGLVAALTLALGAFETAHASPTAFTKRASIASIPQDVWTSFNASVSGHLHIGEPMLAPCYKKYNGETQSPNPAECTPLQFHGGDLAFATGQFGYYVNSQWGNCQTTGDSCVLGPLRPDLLGPVFGQCMQGSVPSMYVDVHGPEDVQKTMEFVRKHKVRLVVKNTGHDYSGRSSAPDSLALWMHNLQPAIELDEEFVAEGCDPSTDANSTGPAVTFGAGQQFGSLYEFVQEHGYRVVGGSSLTVGAAGGWITGGGHSLLSNELGMGADNVQQLRAVLPNGKYVTASRCQNQDIFFALRGGGGGTFGVVTEMTTRVHPKKDMQFVNMVFTNIGKLAQERLMKILVDNGEKWASEGWGGYIYTLSVGTGVFIGTGLLSHEEAKKSMKPLTEFALLFNLGIVNIETTDVYLDGLQDFLNLEQFGISPGSAWALSSRIVKKDSFSEDKKGNLTSILTDFLNVQQKPLEGSIQILVLCLTVPTVYSQSMPESDLPGGPGHSAIPPYWRDGIWHALHLRSYDGTMTKPEKVLEIAQNAHEAMNPLREFTPDSGAYINEADPWEPDHIHSFWGQENYDRLLKIKKEVDPDNLLMVHQGVGWDEHDGRFDCYPDVQ